MKKEKSVYCTIYYTCAEDAFSGNPSILCTIVKQIVKPTLLAFAVCTAFTASIGGFNRLLRADNILNVFTDGTSSSTASNGVGTLEINANKGSSNACVLRTFTCSKNQSPSCFKRWHSKEISCNDSACTGASCTTKTDFLARYSFQQWDLQNLSGPFPRNETMCVSQVSDCPLDDPFCLSSVSLQQVPCEASYCNGSTCIQRVVFVDKDDVIVGGTPVVQTNTNDDKEDEEEDEDQDEDEDVTDGIRDTSGSDDKKDDDSNNQDDNGSDSTGENTKETEKEVQNNALGCFDEKGNWTTHRSECSKNQKQYVVPQMKTVQSTAQGEQETTTPVTTSTTTVQDANTEIEIQQTIEELFVPEPRKSTLVQGLLSSITEADGRLSTILSNAALPEAIRSALTKEQEVLGSLQRSISAPNQSMRNLQQLGDSLSRHLQTIQTIVQSLQGDRKPPTTVTEKLDAIFTGLPEVFSLLLQEGISVDNTMLSGYIGAEAEYSPIRTACMQNVSSCNDLVRVIDALGPVYQSLQDTLIKAERTDLQAKIDELLR